MKRVILCPNPYRDKGLLAAKRADAILRQSGLQTVFCLPFKPEGGEEQFGVSCRPLQQEIRSCDLIVAFGGDRDHPPIWPRRRPSGASPCWG